MRSSYPACRSKIGVGVRGYTDDEQLDIEEMLRDMEQEKTASYTSCPAPGAWLEQFEKADRTFAPYHFVAAVWQHE